ncbi:myocardin-related transcription factor B-like isoform X2 [Mytilus californianus]|uniref:myocardin-related transcription factor B-like isoform X2 n=1 Tax=Mytilus californianus TaxID=6549 RepID=UPI002245D7B9|nr:myocardin-related transcription factor B-like isoform X2 [Mytilus californianus]
MACLVQNTNSVDSSSSSSWSPLYGGGAHLDQEAIQYIHKFYCKDCRMEAEKAKAAAADGTTPKLNGEEEKPTSPQSTLEEMSLQQSMDKNKESLKRKLMMRRSVTELVDQGIYPPLKTPPAFAEQRKSLERAKTGDLLRYKISHRPDRQQLVQQHILEDTTIDPSLHERQRLLKRARLVDDLNVKLNHRPGPLDLMKGNILKTEDEKFMEALQDGTLPFLPNDDDHPFTFDDDSNTSEGAYSPSQGDDSGMSDIGSPPIIPPAPSPPNQNKAQKLFQSNLAKLPVVTTQTFSITNTNNITSGGNYSIAQVKNGNSNYVTKVRPKKSNRPKTQTKSKVIKFHEYKGPPNVVKSTNPASTSTTQQQQQQQQIQQQQQQLLQEKSDTPYHILLQQQQLFLQWQLEFNGNNLNLNKLDKLPPGVVMSTGTTSSVTVTSPTPMSANQGHFQTVTQQTITSPLSVSQPQLVSQANIMTSISPSPSIQTKMVSPTVVQSSQSPICQPQVQLNPPSKPVATKVVPHKPLANLEDMKVADLKAELKKRNLPVSGPKPQLIERLKPYADTIITNSLNIASKNISALSKLPVQAIVNVKKFPVIKSDDVSMSNSSPTSPRTLESFMPLSPEIMEMVTSPQALISQQQNNIIQNSVPMTVDNSRPPSVAPMDVAMEVDQTPDPSNIIQQSFNQSSLSPSSSTITLVTSPTQQQVHLIQAPLDQQQIQIIQPQTAVPKNGEALSPEQLIREEMLQQQRHKISELQRQLEDSQRRLKLQQMQHQHLQQQQQQLNQLQQQTAQLNQLQQQTQLLQQPTSPPQIVSSQMLQQPISPPLVVNSNMSPQPVTSPLTVKTSLIQPRSPPQAVNVSPGNHPTQILAVSQPEGTTTILQIPLNALQNATRLTTVDALKAVNTSVQPTITNNQLPKVSMTNLFSNQVLHQSLNMGTPGTSLSSLINIQPIQTTAGKTVNLPPLNGLSQQHRAISVPSSPVEGKANITRAKSNPFFIPSKEPPRYDEAVKNMHNLAQGGLAIKSEPGVSSASTQAMTKSISTPIIKSQAMDDVLEILIRHGELPPSAAQEPPPTPKTTAQSLSTSTVNSATSSYGGLTSSAAGQFPQFTMTLASTMPTTSTTSVTDVVSSLLNSSPSFSVIKSEPITPPCSVAMTTTSDICTSDILDINEMLNQDLSSMDWTSESPFTQLDLNEGTCLPSELDKNNQSEDFLHVPQGINGMKQGTVHGSEPDIAALGINDLENSQNINMQMDVSDWLDVIMPSTGLTPLSANAPVAFPSDPILTPKTQQEVLDLFNFEDTDFSQTDMQSGINWEKLTETNIN